MKRIFAMSRIVGVIAVVLVLSLTVLSTNTSANSATSTATVTHVEVTGNGEVIKELKKETYAYPVGEKFNNYMSYFEGYVISGISSSSIGLGGVERVVAKVEWKKVEEREEKRTEKVPYETKENDDPTLDKGEKVVDQAGVDGEKLVTYKVTYVGGIENNRKFSSEEVIVEPVNEIIRVGTKVTEVKEEQKTEVIPYEIKEKDDPTLDKGKKVVDQAGIAGEKTITYNVIYVNGEEVDREIISEEVTVEPVNEIILLGTKVTEVKEEQNTEVIPYEIREKDDPTLDRGRKLVDQEGVTGEKIVTYQVTYVNGEETEREAISEEVIGEPTDEIILVGTKDVIEVKEEEKTEEIPYETIKKEDSSLEKGKEVVDQAGVIGGKVITYEVTYVNGKETERKVMSEEITIEPENKIIRIGIKIDESVKKEEGTTEDDELFRKEEGTTGDNESIKKKEATNVDDETEKTNKGMITKSDNKDDDNQLPKTSTSIFNWMMGGLIALAAGLIGIFTARRKVSR